MELESEKRQIVELQNRVVSKSVLFGNNKFDGNIKESEEMQLESIAKIVGEIKDCEVRNYNPRISKNKFST